MYKSSLAALKPLLRKNYNISSSFKEWKGPKGIFSALCQYLREEYFPHSKLSPSFVKWDEICDLFDWMGYTFPKYPTFTDSFDECIQKLSLYRFLKNTFAHPKATPRAKKIAAELPLVLFGSHILVAALLTNACDHVVTSDGLPSDQCLEKKNNFASDVVFLHGFPFAYPSEQDREQFTILFAASKSCAAVFAALVEFIERCLRIPKNVKWSVHNVSNKLEFAMDILTSSMNAYPPGPLLASACARRINSAVDVTESDMRDRARELALNFRTHAEQFASQPKGQTPRTSRTQANILSAPPVYLPPPVETRRLTRLHQTNDQPSHMFGDWRLEQPNVSSSEKAEIAEEPPVSTNYEAHRFVESKVTTKVAVIPDVMLYVQRMLKDNDDEIQENITSVTTLQLAENEMSCSVSPGILTVRWGSITWAGVEKDRHPLPHSTTTSVLSTALTIIPQEVQLWTTGRLGPGFGKHVNSYFVALLADEVFQFLPFTETECAQLCLALTDVFDMAPLPDTDFFSEILTRKLNVYRNHALRKLVSETKKNVWIDHTDKLMELLTSLILDKKPQNIYDMERLYQSCWLNEEVAREALKRVQQIWATNVPEETRIKVLNVVDRLIDGGIFVGAEFHQLVEWISSMSKDLDVYKSGQSVNMILSLRERTQEHSGRSFLPLREAQLKERFVNLKEFQEHRQKYT